MDTTPLLESLRTARREGRRVRDWSLHVVESRRISLGVKDRQAGNAHAPLSLSQSGGVRYLLVWDDGRISRGRLERRQVEEDARRAVEDARSAAYDDPDAAVVLGTREFPEVLLHDAAAAGLARGETSLLVERLDLVRRAANKERLRTWSGSFGASETTERLITSAGLDARAGSTSAGWHVTVNGEIGDGFTARRPEDRGAFEERLARLLELAASLDEPARSPRAGRQPVILHPHVVEAYVLDTLFSNLDGATVAHGEGHFRREQFGADAPVLREDLTLRIDPLQPLRSGSYRFTGEGVPAAPCVYIRRGRPLTPVLSLKYSRRLGLAPTPVPSAADTTSFTGSGLLERAEALARVSRGALVLTVLGVHTQDRASGDFSLSAPLVLQVAGGRLGGRFGATLSGNLFELLNSEELAFVRFEGESTPGLLVECRLDPR